MTKINKNLFGLKKGTWTLFETVQLIIILCVTALHYLLYITDRTISIEVLPVLLGQLAVVAAVRIAMLVIQEIGQELTIIWNGTTVKNFLLWLIGATLVTTSPLLVYMQPWNPWYLSLSVVWGFLYVRYGGISASAHKNVTV